MHFKNKRPRKFRSGCHLCKPHKGMGNHSKFFQKKHWVNPRMKNGKLIWDIVPVPQLDVVV